MNSLVCHDLVIVAGIEKWFPHKIFHRWEPSDLMMGRTWPSSSTFPSHCGCDKVTSSTLPGVLWLICFPSYTISQGFQSPVFHAGTFLQWECSEQCGVPLQWDQSERLLQVGIVAGLAGPTFSAEQQPILFSSGGRILPTDLGGTSEQGVMDNSHNVEGLRALQSYFTDILSYGYLWYKAVCSLGIIKISKSGPPPVVSSGELWGVVPASTSSGLVCLGPETAPIIRYVGQWEHNWINRTDRPLGSIVVIQSSVSHYQEAKGGEGRGGRLRSVQPYSEWWGELGGCWMLSGVSRVEEPLESCDPCLQAVFST